MRKIGLEVPVSVLVSSVEEALAFAAATAIRSSSAFVHARRQRRRHRYNAEECETVVRRGLDLSPVHQVLVEESLLGGRSTSSRSCATQGQRVVVCSIENFDPWACTPATRSPPPSQTLTTRSTSACGTRRPRSCVRCAWTPAARTFSSRSIRYGRLVVIEMNPRVSRSSRSPPRRPGSDREDRAKLAAGYTLDEILNDITRKTPAAFERRSTTS